MDRGERDTLVVTDDDTGTATDPGFASFYVSNIDAGAILVSPSSHRHVHVTCPGTATVRVKVGKGLRELTVLQRSTGQVLLDTPIREGGRWYILARTFGAWISRDLPLSIGPSSFGCAP